MPRRRTLLLMLSLAAAAILIFASTWRREAASLPVATCDLNAGPCAVDAGPGRPRIEFSIAPRPIALMKPLQLRVTANGGTLPDTARVSFSGVAMDMGFNESSLRRQADGSLAGEAILPVCTTGRMQWQAELRLGEAGSASARFRFFVPAH